MGIDQFHTRNVRDEPEDERTERVIVVCIEVHREVGPGLREIMYEEALCHELELRGIAYERQVPVAVTRKGKMIGTTRIDLLIESCLIMELKACDSLNAIHRAQCICYLRATGRKIAL